MSRARWGAEKILNPACFQTMRRPDPRARSRCRTDENTDQRLPPDNRRPGKADIEHRHDGARYRLTTT
jgi:hypothetical protein